jgi:hypothetical protein
MTTKTDPKSTVTMQTMQMRTRRSPAVLAAAPVAAVLLSLCAACGSAAPSSTSTSSPGTASAATQSPSAANSALCADVQSLRSDLDQLKALDAGSTSADQLKALVNQIKTDIDKAAHDATGLASVKFAAVATAYSALSTAINNLPDSDTATQVYQAVKPELDALATALAAAVSTSDCPSPTA